MNLIKKSLFCLLSLMAVVGCSQFKDMDASTGSVEQKVPAYASTNELMTIANNSDYADYRVSRVFALMSAYDFKTQYGWGDITVSELPVIIYNQDSEPKYYEFHVIQDGKIVGAVSCSVIKAEGKPVRYVLNSATKVASSLLNTLGESKVVDSGYPGHLSVKGGVSGSLKCMDASTGEEDTNTSGGDVSVLAMLENADNDTLSNLGITNDAQRQALILEETSKKESLASLWASIDNVKDQILATSDEDIANAAKASLESQTKGNWTSTYQLNRWWNKAYWYNPGIWCGPTCIYFISIGLDAYPGAKTTVWSQATNALKEVYAVYENEIGTGAKFWENLKPALENHTSYTLDLGDKGHGWDKVNSYIRKYAAPAISLRTWASRNGVWTWEWHYRVVCGTKRIHTEWTSYILWWSYLSTSNEDWYLMHDNGFDGGNFWEKAGSLAQFECVSSKAK